MLFTFPEKKESRLRYYGKRLWKSQIRKLINYIQQPMLTRVFFSYNTYRIARLGNHVKSPRPAFSVSCLIFLCVRCVTYFGRFLKKPIVNLDTARPIRKRSMYVNFMCIAWDPSASNERSGRVKEMSCQNNIPPICSTLGINNLHVFISLSVSFSLSL